MAWARLLLQQRKFPQAQQELLAALQLKPSMGTAYGDLAAAANENKNYELVIKALDARAPTSARASDRLFSAGHGLRPLAPVTSRQRKIITASLRQRRETFPTRNGRLAIA